MITLSAPARSGYRRDYEHLSDARWDASVLLGVPIADMVEVDSGDGGTTYCYASQADADADRDGAYAVQYSEVIHDKSMTLQEIDWTKMGQALRASAIDAHGIENMPRIESAYDFLVNNPECFGEFLDWPADMPQYPPIPLIAAYYTPDAPATQSPAPATEDDEYVWIKIGIRATKNSDGSGWDLKCGEDKARDVNGIRAAQIMHAYCDECLDALQSVIDQAEPMTEPKERDSEDELERHSGCPGPGW